GEQPALAVGRLVRHDAAVLLDAVGQLDVVWAAPGLGDQRAQPRQAGAIARQGVERALLVAADRIPGVAVARGAAHARRALAADPDRRMRFLHRFGLEHDVVDL